MLVVKIDLKKIDQSKCFNGKNGAKYLDIVLMENRNGEDQYGNSHMAVQGLSQAEREAGNRGVILGNAKTIGTKASPKPQRPSQPAPAESDDDIPF